MIREMIKTLKAIFTATRKAAIFEGEQAVWTRVQSSHEAIVEARLAMERYCLARKRHEHDAGDHA